MRYSFTNHAVDRFKERFQHHIGDLPCKTAIAKVIYRAKESKQHINDTVFMLEQYEKYGYNDVKVLVYEDVVFICRGSTLVTVYCINNRHKARHKHGKKKVS